MDYLPQSIRDGLRRIAVTQPKDHIWYRQAADEISLPDVAADPMFAEGCVPEGYYSFTTNMMSPAP